MTARPCLILIAAFEAAPVATALATDYTLVAASTVYWTNPASFTPNGVPGAGDTVLYTNRPWSGTVDLYLDQVWSVDTFTCTGRAETVNNQNVNMSSNGTARVIRWLDSSTGGNGFQWQQNNDRTLTLSEFHLLGTRALSIAFGGPVSAYWQFSGDARFTYHQQA